MSDDDPQGADASGAPDAACVQRAREGCDEARETLARHLQEPLRRFVAKRAGARLLRFSSIEDLTQDVLAGALGALDRLRPGAGLEDLRALCFQHAAWVVLRRGRQAGEFRPESEHGAPGGVTPEPSLPTVSQGPVTRADQRRWLDARVAALDERQAAVLRLFLAGRSFGEIAAELGIPENTARKRFLRASQKLSEPEGAD